MRSKTELSSFRWRYASNIYLSMATHVSVMVILVCTANKDGSDDTNAYLCSSKSDSSESMVVILAISSKIDFLRTGA